MLKHFIPKISPVANPKNIVTFENYRITVLDQGLFRIEQNMDLTFHDSATQSVWFRNMPPQSFQVKRDGKNISITTDRASLVISPIFSESYIIINGRKLPLENSENLLGTYRTLDCYDGEISIRTTETLKLDNGVCSKNGLAVMDDSASLLLCEDGTLAPPSEDVLDLYVFAYGTDYRSAVRSLYSICGYPPMLPRFAFGNWWSRYHAYSDKEYLHLLDSFEENGIPLTVATLDVDWHYSDRVDEEKQITAQGKNTKERGCLPTTETTRIGWTGYSWNQNLFPDYKTFLRELKARDLKITLNLHPSFGVRYYEDMYAEMATAMGVDPATEQVIDFNISNPTFLKAYFEILHHPYEKDGVDFWWIDWQQGSVSEMDGLDPLWALNHYHYLDNGRKSELPLIMSRYAGIGSHRYPIGFSGDTTISWKTLELMPYFTATASNIGYTWWGHDIGGHHLGVKDDELYLRFLQFGVFNPINRMHCTDSQLITKEPWMYENGIGELTQKMMILRHRMIPFLYHCNYLTHAQGLSLCEPLYYSYPDATESYQFKNQYLFGQQMIVAPITRHSQQNGLSELQVWLPEGVWTDFFTGDIYRVGKGGKVFTCVRPLDSIPVFVRSGAVIPLSCDGGNRCDNPHSLEARIYNGNGISELYEDSGSDTAFTKFRLEESNGVQSVTVWVEGNTRVIPSGRTLKLTFPNIIIHHPADQALELQRAEAIVTVLKDGIPCEATVRAYGEVSVTVRNFDANAVYTMQIAAEPLPILKEAARAVIAKLQKTQGVFATRDKLLKILLRAKNVNSLANRVWLSDLTDLEKARLTETIFTD